ncbi:hypothetical protein KCU64_g20354, partial [Aureobasidium melanogenum]
MASLSLDGSPTPRKKTPLNFFLHNDDQFEDENTHIPGGAPAKRDTNTAVSNAVPLTTSRFNNQLPPPPPTTRNSSYKQSQVAAPAMSMPANGFGLGVSQAPPARNVHLDELLAKLSEQQVLLNKQSTALHAQRAGETSPGSSGSGALTNPYAATTRIDH